MQASAAPLLALLRTNDNKDAYLRFAAAYALSKHSRGWGACGRREGSVRRRATRRAARVSPHDDPAIAGFLDDSDAFIVREAAEAINDVPIERRCAPLAGKLASAPVADEALVVRALNANFRLGDAPRAQALANYALKTTATAEMRAEALKQLGTVGQGAAARSRGGHLSSHEGAPASGRGRRCRRPFRSCWPTACPSRCNWRRWRPSSALELKSRVAGAGRDGEQREGIRAGAHQRAQDAGRHGRGPGAGGGGGGGEIRRAGAAPGGAADRGASRARARAAGHQALRASSPRWNSRRRSRPWPSSKSRRPRRCW